MDKWKDYELAKMKAGGNEPARQFFESHSDFDSNWSLKDKYNSKTAALLRDKVLVESKGEEWDESTSAAQSHVPPQARSSELASSHKPRQQMASSNQAGGAADDIDDFESWLNDDTTSMPTMPKAKYVGFGSQGVGGGPSSNVQANEGDFLAGAMSSLTTGWSFASKWTTSAASMAKENAVKLGSQATVVAYDLKSKVNDHMVKPAHQKLTEGKVVDGFTTSVSSWATKLGDYGRTGISSINNIIQPKSENENAEFWDTFGSTPKPATSPTTTTRAKPVRTEFDDVISDSNAAPMKASASDDVDLEAWLNDDTDTAAAAKPATNKQSQQSSSGGWDGWEEVAWDNTVSQQEAVNAPLSKND